MKFNKSKYVEIQKTLLWYLFKIEFLQEKHFSRLGLSRLSRLEGGMAEFRRPLPRIRENERIG
jgi:hypothetical protein